MLHLGFEPLLTRTMGFLNQMAVPLSSSNHSEAYEGTEAKPVVNIQRPFGKPTRNSFIGIRSGGCIEMDETFKALW